MDDDWSVLVEKVLSRDAETSPVEVERRRLYTVPQVVYQTSLSRSTIYNEIAAGRLRVVKLGRAVRVPADELDRWIEELGSRDDAV